jgi:hypothetical protein
VWTAPQEVVSNLLGYPLGAWMCIPVGPDYKESGRIPGDDQVERDKIGLLQNHVESIHNFKPTNALHFIID